MDILLTGILMIAVLADLATYKIPNALTIVGLVASLVYGIHTGGPPELLISSLNVLISFIILFPLYLIKALGAGDIKLFIVLASYYGFRSILVIVFCSLFISAIYGLLKKIFLILIKKKKGLCRLHFAPCIFIAFILHIVHLY